MLFFRKMLKKGNPPDDWDGLLNAAAKGSAPARLARVRPPR